MTGTSGLEPLVGRGGELGFLLDAVAEAREGRPGYVLVEADAGLGKTRLVQEVLRHLGSRSSDHSPVGRRGVSVGIGHGVDLAGGHVPYGMASEILAQLVRQAGDQGLAAFDRRLVSALSVIEPSLGDVPDGTVVDRLTLLAGFSALIDLLGSTGLVCLVAEDLHWADEPSLDLLTLLAAAPPTPRLLLLATTRPLVSEGGRAARFVSDLGGAMRGRLVGLDPLPDVEVVTHLRSIREGALSEDRIQQVTALAQGVPLFLDALVSDLDEFGDRLPSTITASVSARMSRLAPPTRRVVEAAAVRGLPVDRRSLAAVTGLDEEDLRRAVHEAGQVHLLASLGGGRHQLRHAIVRRAIEETLGDPSRESWHRAWALWLENAAPGDAMLSSSLAHHWYHAGDASRAITAAVAAARTATELEATEETALHWARVKELWFLVDDPSGATGVDRETLVMSLYWALGGAGDVAGRNLLLATELTTVPAPKGVRLLWLELRRYLQPCRAGTGVPHRAVGSLTWEEVLALARSVLAGPAVSPSAMLLGVLGTLLNRSLPDDLGDRVETLVRELAPELVRDESTRVLALHVQGYLLLRQRRYEEALSRELEAERAPDRGGPKERHRATANVVSSLVILGRAPEAVEHGERALARLGPVEVARAEWIGLAQNVILARVHAGGWDRAHELFDRHREHADWWPIGESAGGLALISAWQGRHEKARQVIALCAEDLPGFDVASEPLTYAYQPRLASACLAEVEGEVAMAREHLRPVLTSSRLPGDSGVLWVVVLEAARLALLRRETTRERQAWADLVTSAAQQVDTVGVLGDAWLADVRANLDRAAGHHDADQWQEVVGRWDRLGFEHRQALGRIRRAEALLQPPRPSRGGGSTREARRELVVAQSLLRPLGAVPALLEVQRLAGRGRLRLARDDERASEPGLPGLTSREMEVAGLIALGRTNQQIASELFMSPKTASVHVSRIISKLGVQNRTGVAAMVHREGLVDR